MDRRQNVEKNSREERGKTENRGCVIGTTVTPIERGV